MRSHARRFPAHRAASFLLGFVVLVLAAPALAGRFVASDAAKPPRDRLARGIDFARKDGRRHLVLFRRPDCDWCDRLRAAFTENDAVEQELIRDYIITSVDVSRPDGRSLAKDLQADLALGLPLLTILDDAGRPVAQQETAGFERGDGHDPQKLLAFFRKWAPPRKDARALYKVALERAGAQGKRLLVVLGSPFCAGCYALADVLDAADVKGIVAKDYEVVKVDIDRMDGGREVARGMGFPEDGGVPWLAVADAQGRVVTSTGATMEAYASPFRLIELGARHLKADELALLSRKMGAWGGRRE